MSFTRETIGCTGRIGVCEVSVWGSLKVFPFFLLPHYGHAWIKTVTDIIRNDIWPLKWLYYAT